jgi:hypothetical protein
MSGRCVSVVPIAIPKLQMKISEANLAAAQGKKEHHRLVADFLPNAERAAR